MVTPESRAAFNASLALGPDLLRLDQDIAFVDQMIHEANVELGGLERADLRLLTLYADYLAEETSKPEPNLRAIQHLALSVQDLIEMAGKRLTAKDEVIRLQAHRAKLIDAETKRIFSGQVQVPATKALAVINEVAKAFIDEVLSSTQRMTALGLAQEDARRVVRLILSRAMNRIQSVVGRGITLPALVEGKYEGLQRNRPEGDPEEAQEER